MYCDNSWGNTHQKAEPCPFWLRSLAAAETCVGGRQRNMKCIFQTCGGGGVSMPIGSGTESQGVNLSGQVGRISQTERCLHRSTPLGTKSWSKTRMKYIYHVIKYPHSVVWHLFEIFSSYRWVPMQSGIPGFCLNGGSCETLPDSSVRCHCTQDYHGDRCENEGELNLKRINRIPTSMIKVPSPSVKFFQNSAYLICQICQIC